MKKNIANSFVLATLLGTTPQISILTTANTKLHNENNLQKWTPTPEDFEYIEKYFNFKTEQEKQELKENLLSAIGLKNDVVVFDKTKLNEKKWDLKIYQIITSDEYLKTLNWLYKNKMLTFDEQEKAHFNFPKIKNLKIDGIWYETYWYWFGWAKLHLSSSKIEAFTDFGESTTEIAEQIIEVAPYLVPVALIIASVITANAAILKSYDYGNGAWLGLLWFIPDMGFGSN